MQWRTCLVALLACVGCGDDRGGPSDSAVVDSTIDSSSSDATLDTAQDAANDALFNPDAPAGATCAFNRDCMLSHRCECDEMTGTCECQPGTRGTGRNGVDVCTSRNDCASSLCVEGPMTEFYCSDECVDETGCTGMLPRCLDIAFVGRICARIPPP